MIPFQFKQNAALCTREFCICSFVESRAVDSADAVDDELNEVAVDGGKNLIWDSGNEGSGIIRNAKRCL